MRGPSPRQVVAHLLLAAALLLLYGRDVLAWRAARAAEVAARAELPSLALALLGLLAAVGGLGLLAWGWRARRPAGWQGYRALPVAAVVVLFLDFAVLASTRSPLGSADRAALAVELFTARAQQLAAAAVSTDQAALEAALAGLPPAPYLLRGRPVGGWRLAVRRGCGGPPAQPEGSAPGTLVYCVAPDARTAWVVAIGLPEGVRAGPPGVVGTSDELAGTVRAAAPPADVPPSPTSVSPASLH